MKAEIKQLTILGATGNLGAPVTKYLSCLGCQVTAIARNIEKAKQIFGDDASIRIVYGDLQNLSSLQKALQDTEYLYLNLSTTATDIQAPFIEEREGIANILKAVNPKKIKQILSISGLGAFQHAQTPDIAPLVTNVIRRQGHELLKKSGIPYTILHCSWFADSFVIFQRNKTYAVIGNTKTPIFFTNVFDYATKVYNALSNEKALFNEYPIQGKTGICHVQAAKDFFAVYDDSVQIKIVPTWILGMMSFFKKEMKPIKLLAEYSEKTSETFLAEQYDTYNDLGNCTMSLAEYAEKLKKERFYDYLSNLK
ncbi:MAG: NAD(P)H-binding protein [Bacteroidales bacterium]